MLLDHDKSPPEARPGHIARVYETTAGIGIPQMAAAPGTGIPAAATPGRLRRRHTAGLLVLALLTGAAGGGAAGMFAASRALPSTSASTSVVAAEPISRQEKTAAGVAGAVYAAVSPSVIEISVAGASMMGPTY